MPLASRSVALALDTGAYAIGDSMCDLLSITTAVRRAGYCAELATVLLVDKDDQGAALDLYFFDRAVTLPAKNAVWNVSDADMLFCQARIPIASGDWTDLGGNRVANLPNLGRIIQPSGSSTLYMGAVSQGAGTYTASGLYLTLGFRQD